LEKLIVTNSIPITSSKFHYDEQYRGYEKIEVVDVAPLFASVIKNIENHTSISANFLI
jgi:phosphoribosylpyrophosphate synthetase